MLLGAALSVAVLVAVLLLARRDGLRAATIGHHAGAANARAFLFGAGLWLAPALAGLALCIAAGFALVLGYARAVGGSIWVSIGIHTAWMTTTQLLLSPLYGMATVQGVQTLQFVAFVLLPSATICTVLASLRPRFSWRAIAAP